MDSLKANPLFVREWRRVFGRRRVFVFRVLIAAVLAIILFELSSFVRINWSSRSPQYAWIQVYLEVMIRSAFLNPLNWLAALLAWWSIEFEHRRGTANSIALTRLSHWELFWAKTVPTACFSAAVVWLVMFIQFFRSIHALHIFSGSSAGSGLNVPAFMTQCVIAAATAPLLVFVTIMVCYSLLLKWPALRRSGLVILPTLMIWGLFEAGLVLLPALIFLGILQQISLLQSAWWGYLGDSASRVVMTAGLIYFLIRVVGPQFRGMFLDEAPRFPFVIVLRGRVKIRRMWRGARTWTDQ